MARYLVIFKTLVDDVEVNGFRIMTDKELETFERLAESITWGFTYNFIHFSDGQDLLSSLEYKEISLEDSKVFKKLFGTEFGVFINETFLQKVANDDIEDIDSDDFDDEEGLPLISDDDDDY